MHRGPFLEFTRQLNVIAQDWPTRHHDIASTPTGQRYDALAPTVLREVAANTETPLPDKLTNHNALHGMAVITRFLGFAALAGNREGLTLEELGNVIHAEKSFDQLGTIASTQNKVALRTEVDYGIGTPLSHDTPYATTVAQSYLICDGAIKLDYLPLTQYRHHAQLIDEGHETYEARCAAHKSDALRHIYHSLGDICLRDELLFALTLAN
jgi:hypothetical protein